jgi:hypothetical protein
MEKNYIIKSVSLKKDMSWKTIGYNINYHHEKSPDYISSAFYTVEDFTKLFGITWDSNVQALVGQRVWLEKKLIIK